jgi:tRNA threonylcarbamoyladenosine biosynthesis protein TsaE
MTDAHQSTMTLLSASVEQTVAIGRIIGGVLRQGDVIALSGPLGAGKTQLVRGMADGVGTDPRLVASPTYVLMHEYTGRLTLVHIDAYRLQGLSDLESIGWTDELLDESATVIEWADRIAPELPADCLTITLNHVDDNTRQLTLQFCHAWGERLSHLRESVSTQPSPLHPRKHAPTPCPVCRSTVATETAAYPFCSERCRMVDLNRWFSEEYRLSRPIEPEDEMQF